MQDDPFVGLLVVVGVLAGLGALLVLMAILEPAKDAPTRSLPRRGTSSWMPNSSESKASDG